jgi:glycosyltransferase involved in cell wall biosynthesis
MFEFMACARPILLAVDGEARRVAVEEAGAAVYVEPEDATALAQAVRALRDQPEYSHQMGARGRAYVEEHYDRDRIAGGLEGRIGAVMAARKGQRAIRERASAVVADEPST